MERQDRHEALLIEEADAWFEYLEATQAEAETGRYDEVEPWAWARLNQRLRAVERKRTGLRPCRPPEAALLELREMRTDKPALSGQTSSGAEIMRFVADTLRLGERDSGAERGVRPRSSPT